MRKFTVDDWQQRLNTLNQPVIIVGRRKENKKEIFDILCFRCGNTFSADRKSLFTACNLRERGKYVSDWCPICNRKKSVEGLNDVATVRQDLVKYFVDSEDAKKHSTGSHARVQLACPDCGNKKTYDVSNLCARGFHCDYCSDYISLGNKIIRNLVLQLPIEDYSFEYSDSWTQNKRYDAYFKYRETKYLIEIDGMQHIRDTNWATKEQQRANDILKAELAMQNGYKLIRIKAYKSDFDYIKKNVLDSELATIFDMSSVDWEMIHEQTITSMNIMIAKYYMEHENMLLRDIAKHFNISHPTLIKVLKKLTKTGMCNYSKAKSFENAKPHIKRIKEMKRKVV